MPSGVKKVHLPWQRDLIHPNRISCWLRDEDRWLHKVLEELAIEVTKKGIKTNKSDLVRTALVEYYSKLKPNEEKEESLTSIHNPTGSVVI